MQQALKSGKAIAEADLYPEIEPFATGRLNRIGVGSDADDTPDLP